MKGLSRPRWLKATVCLGLIAGLLLSPKLWLTTRTFQLTPVVPVLPSAPNSFDHVVYAAMLLLLGLIVVMPGASRLIAVFVFVALGYALFDQQRWQPWFYQYVFMLMAIGLGKENVCRLIIVSIYFWSGVQKINPGFTQDAFQWMVGPLSGSLPAGLAYAAPIVESAIGIGLLTRTFRNPAVIAALAMHAFILAAIGPLGHNHNTVVWPWNIAMGAFVILLFWRTPEVGMRDVLWGSGFHKVVLVLFAIMPALSLEGLWDSYLSFALYSGNQQKGTIYMADSVAGKLPDEIQEVVDMSESDVDTLDIKDWSLEELNVPVYAETRVFKNVARRVCSDAGNPSQMVLVIEGKRMWLQRRRMILYTCDMLQR